MLELISVKKAYKTKAGVTVALNGINLKFADKGLVFITGKSGCGKTTLLNMIGGLDNLDSGDIIVDGKKFSEFALTDYDNYRNTLVGFVFQEYNLLPEFSVKKNINIANELQSKTSEGKEVKKLLDTVDIGGLESRKPAQLSGGQKQRVAIARALIKNPKIVLADEPTGALDSATGVQVMDILKELSKDKLVIVVSHEREYAEKYADRIIKMVDGQVVEDISLSDVEINESVYELDQEIIVKTGTKLNKEEADKVIGAIQKNKKVSVTDKITVREKQKTKEVETKKPERSIEFIKSKMKFKSILALSLKSLFSKPIRLVFTILLSVIAFSVFGIFDAVASYNGQKALANLLETAQYNAVSVVASVDNDKNNNVQLKLSQNYIDYLNSELGYEFRGIYDLNDKEIISQNKRANLNYEYSLNQLSTGTSSSTAVSELYYKRKVNGIVEFKESEIKNGVILKNSFNYKILPYENAKYPTLNIEQNGVQEVGISSYLAESISYWLKHNKQTQFGGKDFIQSDLSSLIGARLYVEGHNFIISAIIDCGKIPEKFQVLKHGGNEKNYNLQYDFETYLNSSCNLTLFLPDGYIAQKRAENKRTTTYVADYIGVKYKAQLEGLFKEHEREKDANYFFYNSNNLSKENTIFFDDVENVQNKERKLEKNQVLISVYDLDKYFYQNKTEAVQDGNSAVADLIQEKINLIKNQTSLESKQQSVKDLIEVLQNFHDLNQEQTLKHVLNKEIVIKKYKGENKQASYTQTYTVVGIYFDIDIDSNYQNKYYPLAMSEDGLKNMGITTNQGIYARAISSLYGNQGDADTLSRMMTQESGFMLKWHKNLILEILEENSVFIDQFVELFLYASIVIIVFSVFMLMNYITASISSKRQTIGVLRALGANGKSVFLMFLIESIIIALINGTLASVVGYAASTFVNAYIIHGMSLTVSFALFGVRQVIIIMLASLITAFISSLMPIIKIVKQKPVELIRKE